MCHNVFILLNMVILEKDSTILSQHVRHQSPTDAAPHPQRTETQMALLPRLKTCIVQECTLYCLLC